MRKVFVLVLVFGLIFASVYLLAQKKSGKTQRKKETTKRTSPPSKQEILPKLEIKRAGADEVEIEFKPGTVEFALFLSDDTAFAKVLAGQKLEKATITDDTLKLSLNTKTKRIEALIASNWNKKSEKLVVTGLNPKTYYSFGLYRRYPDSCILIQSYVFNTLAIEPTRQAQQVSFGEVTDTTIFVRFVKGNGEGRILVGAKGDKVDLPEDGKEYRASSRFGNSEARLGNSFVLYDGKDRLPELIITNLEPGTKYTFAVFEYNGDGKYRNYNINSASNNPRSKATWLNPPEILNVEFVAPDGAFIKWKKVANAVTYILDVALDEEFRNKVDFYNDVDVGDLDTFELSDLVEGTTYYIRLKARGNGVESLYSKPVKFKVEK